MKNNKLPSIVTLMILTVITVIFWVMFNVYRSFTKEPSTSVPANITAPINPRLDLETIELMQTKIYP